MKLVKVEPSSRVKGRWLLWLEDGSLLRVGEGTVADLALRAGLELDEALSDRLLRAAEEDRLWERALSLLSARPYSRRELTDKLTARRKGELEVPPERREAAGAVAGRLTQLGLLDDRAYASALVRHYGGRGYGPRKLREEFYRRGVPREYWEEALEELEDPAAAIDAFVARKLGPGPAGRAALKKVSDALARRGYRWSDIAAALERYELDQEE